MFSIAKKHLLRIGLVSLSFSMIALPMQAKADASSARLTSAQQAFINEIAPHAKRVQKEHGILASITISQAILESNWGKSQLAVRGKNLFGIKGAFRGRSIYLPTKEHNGAVYVGTRAAFKAYPSWYESLNDHALLFAEGPSWNKKLYECLLGETNFRLAARALAGTGYSSDPTYASKLIEVIEKFGLATYDNQDSTFDQMPSVTQTYAVGKMKEHRILNIWSSPNTREAKLVASFSNDFDPKIEILSEAKIDSNKIWYQIEIGSQGGWVNSDVVELIYTTSGKTPFKNQSVGLASAGSTWHKRLTGQNGFRQVASSSEAPNEEATIFKKFSVVSTITLMSPTNLQLSM